MSYIDPPRLHFSGRFFTDPSTVNNIPDNFKNLTNKNNSGNWNWNPFGHHDFSLQNCCVTKVVYGDGSICSDTDRDPVIGNKICSNREVFSHLRMPDAKIADIDVTLQYVPTIFGLFIGLLDDGGGALFKGQFKAVALDDFWFREPTSSSDTLGQDPTSVFYQSVLETVEWGTDKLNSRFLKEIYATGKKNDKLSIKFMLDGYYAKFDKSNPDYLTGRIVGTIGPAYNDEPNHFLSKRFLRYKIDTKVLNTPFDKLFHSTGLYFAPFKLDHKQKVLRLDLGNSLPRSQHGDTSINIGHLWLAVRGENGKHQLLKGIDYMNQDYAETSDIFDLKLTDEEMDSIEKYPICLVENYDGTPAGSIVQVYLEEDSKGRFARADSFVFRFSPGDEQLVRIRATIFGNAAPNVTIKLGFDWRKIENTGLNIDNLLLGSPEEVLIFPPEQQTDNDGWAEFNLKVMKTGPQAPRFDGAIDGQLYTLTYTWEGVENPDPHHYLTVRVFDQYKIIENPVWEDVYPIFNYYAQLFPAMKDIIDLSNEQSVRNNAKLIKELLEKPINHPSYMPVTRDLSKDKSRLLIRFLSQK